MKLMPHTVLGVGRHVCALPNVGMPRPMCSTAQTTGGGVPSLSLDVLFCLQSRSNDDA